MNKLYEKIEEKFPNFVYLMQLNLMVAFGTMLQVNVM